MTSKLIKVSLASVVILAFIVGGLFMAYQNGYNKAVAVYNKEAAAAAERAKKEQAEQQAAITDITDQYYEAADRIREKSTELEKLKRELREEARTHVDAEVPEDCFCYPTPVVPAIYRLFNQAADNPDLPRAEGTREPDEERDGLDAVQYSVAEYNRVAVKVNKLQAVISQSDCFVE